MAAKKPKRPTRLESDALAIMTWLAQRPGQYMTSRMIAEAVDLLPSSDRFRKAFGLARRAFATRGHNLETYVTSREPETFGKPVTRLMLKGAADDEGTRATLRQILLTISPMISAAEACEFQARNRVKPEGGDGEDPMAIVLEESAVNYRNCVASAEGFHRIGFAVLDQQRERDALARRVQELEAQLAVSA